MDIALVLATWFALFTATAVLPWLNAELLMLSLLPVAAARGEVLFLAVTAVVGQMVGKAAIYWLALRGAARLNAPHLARRLDRWRAKIDRPARATPVLLLSSTFGVPPLYVLTILAGSLRLRFGVFLLAATVGRAVHFGTLALLPV